MTNAASFWDKIAPKYAKDPISDMAAYEYTLERTKSYLGADDRVLELGCGTGSTALLLAPGVREIVGTDVSQGMIDIAHQRTKDANVTNADFRTMDAASAARLSEPFDAVLAHNLFHLIPKGEDVFADIHRMLPQGGLFISKTPCLNDKAFGFKRHAIKLAIPVMQWIGKAPYVRFMTQKELEDGLKYAGFEIVEAGNFPATSRYIVARKI